MDSVMILFATLYHATQAGPDWEDDLIVSVSTIAPGRRLFPVPDQDLTPPAVRHCFVMLDLCMDADNGMVCRIAVGPRHRWEEELAGGADEDSRTRLRLYRKATVTEDELIIDDVYWAEFRLSADVGTLSMADVPTALDQLRDDEDQVRARVNAILGQLTNPNAPHVPGASDDDTDTAGEADDDDDDPQPVARISEHLITRVPGGSVAQPVPDTRRHRPAPGGRHAFVNDGMSFFARTFRGADAANDPGLLDRAATALRITYRLARPATHRG
jgi:hypothetical protein